MFYTFLISNKESNECELDSTINRRRGGPEDSSKCRIKGYFQFSDVPSLPPSYVFPFSHNLNSSIFQTFY